MDSRLKQRLVGAAVLVALAVIFLPMLVQGPAPDSGVSDVPLSMPDAPRGDFETRDLPLVAPGDTPDGGAVGMQSTTTTAPVAATPTSVSPADSGSSSSQPVPLGSDVRAQSEALPQQPAALDAPTPAVTAAGDYAVSFGTYATTAAADAVIASLRASRLPARREPTTSDGKQAWRVRIGPYASRADAETARLRAAHVRDDLDARVIVLDAPAMASPAMASTAPPSNEKPVSGSATATAPRTSTTPVSTPSAVASQPATTGSGFAVQLAAYSKPAEATALRDKLRAAGFTAFTESVDTDKGTLTRVRVGPMISRTEAEQLQAQIKAKVGLDGVVRPHP